jgi:hypothetical protein
MKSEGFFSTVAQFLKKLLLIEVVIFSVTGVVCWYVQWRTLDGYSTGLLVAGLLVIGFGSMSVIGENRFNSDPRYLYIQSAMPGSLQEQMQQNRVSRRESMAFSMFTTLIGSVPLLAGLVLKFVR